MGRKILMSGRRKGDNLDPDSKKRDKLAESLKQAIELIENLKRESNM